VPVYADLSDPLEYLAAAQRMDAAAQAAGTTAVLAAGAFPGLSNVLAVELAAQLGERIKDVKFSYFTAGARAKHDQPAIVRLCSALHRNGADCIEF
jgi:saccharopine dehydrogenase-like NADP-dependent oxidoreductase